LDVRKKNWTRHTSYGNLLPLPPAGNPNMTMITAKTTFLVWNFGQGGEEYYELLWSS